MRAATRALPTAAARLRVLDLSKVGERQHLERGDRSKMKPKLIKAVTRTQIEPSHYRSMEVSSEP